MGDGFQFVAPNGWGAFMKFGHGLLGVILTILLAKEAIRLVRGERADWLGVLVRTAIGGIGLSVVPWFANTAGQIALSLGGVFSDGAIEQLERAVRQAWLGGADCSAIGMMDGFGLLFSMRGAVLLCGFVTFVVFVLVKIAVIDIGWKLMFMIVALQAPITIPLSLADGFGGFSLYWRNVLSVAIWPITYGLLIALAAALFPQVLEQMALGKASVRCMVPTNLEEVHDLAEAQARAAYAFIQFVGLMVGMIALTWKVPQISAMIVGGSPSGTLGTLAIGAITAPARMGASVLTKGAIK